MSLYERFASTSRGARALAASRLRYEVLELLHAALSISRSTQALLAGRLGVRRSAVNQVFRGDGNIRINTLAEYMHELGFEVQLKRVPAGRPREDAVRAMQEMRFRASMRLADTQPISARRPSAARPHFTVVAEKTGTANV